MVAFFAILLQIFRNIMEQSCFRQKKLETQVLVFQMNHQQLKACYGT
jgi:hypothetical protein